MAYPLDTFYDILKSTHSDSGEGKTLGVTATITGSIPLPTGAATAANQVTGNTSLSSIDSKIPSNLTVTSTRLLVDGSGVTQPVSGTVAVTQSTSPWVVSGTVTANAGTGNFTVVQSTAASLNATVVGTGTFAVQAAQSGTWNVTNISGTISLPTGAATETTLAKLPLTQGSTTSGQSGVLTQGAVTTAAPSYTTAQTSPLSLTTAGALRTDSSATTQPISGTVTANAGTNLNTSALALDTSVNGILVAQGSTTSGQTGPLVQTATTTSAPTYTTAKTNPLSTDTSGLLRVSLKDTPANTNKFLVTADAITFASPQHVILDSGTLTSITNALPSGTNVIGHVIADSGSTTAVTGNVTVVQGTGTNLHTVIDSGTVTTVSTVTSLTQMNGQAIAMGTGVRSAGTQRVTIATDDVVPASQSGTWTVQPGNTANTTPWLVSSNTTTTGGMTLFRNTALSNTAVAVKASAGNLYFVHFYNSNIADAYVQFYNVAQGSVTVGTTTPDLTLAVPAGGVLDTSYDGSPFSFSTAITIAATTTITGGSAPSTGLLTAIGYK